jgi:hypothetical protein
MAKQVIYAGITANDATGDSLRAGAQSINSNFTELYNALGGESGAPLSLVSKVLAGNGIIVSSPAGEVLVTNKTATAGEIGGIRIGTGITIDENGIASVNVYELPKASQTILGGIKVGARLSIDANGVLSADPGAYTLPKATSSALGGIKIGNGLEIDAGGIVSVSFGSYTLPTATNSVLGGIKVGSRLTIADGVLSADVQVGSVTALNNGVHSFALTSTGKLTLPGSGVFVDTDQFNDAGPNTVIYTTNNTYIRAVKLVVFAEKIVNGYESQACEIIGTIDESANLIYTSTYGVVYTGAGPLFTIESSYNLPTQSFIISATPTGADNINIRTQVTEMSGTQP